MDWLFYAVALPALLLFLGAAGCALHWAATHGQLRALRQSLGWSPLPPPSGTDDRRSPARRASSQS